MAASPASPPTVATRDRSRRAPRPGVGARTRLRRAGAAQRAAARPRERSRAPAWLDAVCGPRRRYRDTARHRRRGACRRRRAARRHRAAEFGRAPLIDPPWAPSRDRQRRWSRIAEQRLESGRNPPPRSARMLAWAVGESVAAVPSSPCSWRASATACACGARCHDAARHFSGPDGGDAASCGHTTAATAAARRSPSPSKTAPSHRASCRRRALLRSAPRRLGT